MTEPAPAPDARTATEELVRRDRVVLLAALALVTLLAWTWVASGAGTGMSAFDMTTWRFPPPSGMGMVTAWSPGYAALMFVMWWVMMIAMMIPSAAPMILLYGRAYRHEQMRGRLAGGVAPTALFALGYLIAWGLFSAAATAAQWGLERAGLVHQMSMWSLEPAFTATLLIAAGLYQFSALKHACLTQCRSPAAFLAQHFEPGGWGALRLGWRHGLYCLGCCWALMALLFAGGVMNLVWIAGLAVFVLAEKLAPGGGVLGRVAGAIMIAVGIWVATGAGAGP